MIAPGIHDIAADVYHSDPCPEPSLSSSGIKTLLNSTPAHFRDRHPRLTETPEYVWPSTKAQELGQVVHKMVLGAGAEYVVGDLTQFRNKDGSVAQTWGNADAKQWKLTMEERGYIVLTDNEQRSSYRNATNVSERMLEAIREEYPQWDDGVSERAFIWRRRLDDGQLIWCRSLVDRFVQRCRCKSTIYGSGVHPHVFDIKSTAKPISDDKLDVMIGVDGWDVQHVWYESGAATVLGTGPIIPFTFVVGELAPPYSVRFVDIPQSWLRITRQRVDRAAQLFGRCMASHEWPDYPRRRDPDRDPPTWLVNQWEQELLRDRSEEEHRGD